MPVSVILPLVLVASIVWVAWLERVLWRLPIPQVFSVGIAGRQVRETSLWSHCTALLGDSIAP